MLRQIIREYFAPLWSRWFPWTLLAMGFVGCLMHASKYHDMFR